MTEIQLIINFDGHWEGSIYQGGDAEIILVDRNLRYEDLFSTVHKMVEVDRSNFVYEIRSLLNASGKTIKLKIKNDRDVQFTIEKANSILKVYVTVKHSQQSSQQPSQPIHELIHQMLGQLDNFVQLLTAQFDSAHASTSFFHPNMWNQTYPPQHMNLPNEDILVRVAEHEDVKENTEYDPDYCVKNDSDENEIERSDKDIWYDIEKNDDDDDYEEKPTFYDSGMWAGDGSFDHHNEADPIANDPINAPPKIGRAHV